MTAERETPRPSARDGGTEMRLTREQVENIKLHYFGREGDQSADGLNVSDVRALCDMALASLAAPGVRVSEGELWHFMRSTLEQGSAIQLDYNAGKYPTYEHYAARIDAAGSERVDQLKAMLSAAPASPEARSDGWVSAKEWSDTLEREAAELLECGYSEDHYVVSVRKEIARRLRTAPAPASEEGGGR